MEKGKIENLQIPAGPDGAEAGRSADGPSQKFGESASDDDAGHLLARGCGETRGAPVMRQELKRMMQFAQPLGTYFLAQAKMLWLDSMPRAMPFMPSHDCASGSCRRVQVTMRVFVRNPANDDNIRNAHLCLYDHVRRRCLCVCPEDHSVHRRELAAIDHDELYFCEMTGRVHVCGPGVCMLAQVDMRREDEYQAVCPVTGLVASDQLNVVVGSEFWKAGHDVGSASDRRSQARHQQYSHSADDLSRLLALHQPKTAEEEEKRALVPVVPGVRKRPAASKGRELNRFIAAQNELTFTHRKKFESPQWLEWAQKFAQWDLWLDVLFAMDSFQKVATHLKDITQENYRKVWGLDGLVRRYATALVYAAFCAERYTSERRAMSDEVAHSVRRISDGSKDQQVVFSQLADATLGSITRTYHGAAFAETEQQQDTSSALSTSVFSPTGNGELKARVTRYAQRVLHLWVIMNESCQGEGLLGPGLKSSLDAFPLAHFVFPALKCFADGLSVTPSQHQQQTPVYAVPCDTEMRRSLPKAWDCIGGGMYDHAYAKLVHANCIYAITSAMQSGRMPLDYLVAYQRQWSDVQLEKARWISSTPNKHIFRHSPKKLFLFNASATSAAVPAVTSTALALPAAPSQPAY